MRVLITGVSGGLGGLIAERLAKLEDVECITGMDWLAPRRTLPAKTRFVKMDVRSNDLAGVMKGHDSVVHTAFLVQWPAKMPESARRDINVNGTCNVAQAAITSRISRFVHASSTAAYDVTILTGKTSIREDFPIGRADSPFYYSGDKAEAERRLQEILAGSRIRLTLLRPCVFVGPNSRVALDILRDTAASLPGRNPRVQLAHEDDVADAFVQAIRSDTPGAYNVGPDDFLRTSEVWPLIGMPVLPVPSRIMQLLVAIKWKYLNGRTHPAWVEARMADFTADNSKLKAIGWKPHYGTADALRAGARKR